MALSTDFAAAQITYFLIATTAMDDNHPTIQTQANELIRKLCSEYPSQADLLWLITFDLWKILDRTTRPASLTVQQFESLLNVEAQWLKILGHNSSRINEKLIEHGRLSERPRAGRLALTDLF
jgi:hypothetical protein